MHGIVPSAWFSLSLYSAQILIYCNAVWRHSGTGCWLGVKRSDGLAGVCIGAATRPEKQLNYELHLITSTECEERADLLTNVRAECTAWKSVARLSLLHTPSA